MKNYFKEHYINTIELYKAYPKLNQFYAKCGIL